MKDLFEDPARTWYLHNAKYDLHILANEGLRLAGKVHCTQAGARLEANDHFTYNLSSCAERIGLEKDDAVEKYIAENHLWEHVTIPGKKIRKKNKYFDKVPPRIIVPYGLRDAEVTARLAWHQETTFAALTAQMPPGVPPLTRLHQNECELTKVVFEIERVGVKIDRAYCERAVLFEESRKDNAARLFKDAVGEEFKASPKLFAKVFESDRERWELTEKGNPSFESDILKNFANPLAKVVLEYRDAKSKADFYQGFLYHADSNDIVHPNLQADGTKSGRFSSTEPNFQNLTSEEDEEELAQEFVVRRALIPRPGFIFIMPDYDQMEYRMMFDYACRGVGYETDIVKRIKAGHDPHQATADAVTAMGTPLTRKRAKNGNFAFLYGAGYATLAKTIGGSIDEARRLKNAIASSAPEVALFVEQVSRAAVSRQFVFNWAGRRAKFDNPRFAYKAPNYLIQGGCADVMKFAMVEVHRFLADKKSRMVLTVHDELLIEVHESELATVPPKVKEIMESIYPWKYLPLTAAMEHSRVSFADKTKGFPV
jgi:DNA polymerase-1